MTDRLLVRLPEIQLPGNRGVVTTYNGNEQYFQETFLEYYRKVWKPDWIVSLVGGDSAGDGQPFGLYDGRISEVEPDHFVVRYLSPKSQQQPEWNLMRDRLLAQVKRCSNNAKILVVDCDEFVSGKIEELWETDSFLSHFVEYVPAKPFDRREIGQWSTRAWYYRSQALKETISNPHLRCKRFPIKNGQIGFHANENCGYDCPTSANGQSVTFHVGVASKEHFMSSKHFDQTTPEGESLASSENPAADTFHEHHETCQFETFPFRLWDLIG